MRGSCQLLAVLLCVTAWADLRCAAPWVVKKTPAGPRLVCEGAAATKNLDPCIAVRRAAAAAGQGAIDEKTKLQWLPLVAADALDPQHKFFCEKTCNASGAAQKGWRSWRRPPLQCSHERCWRRQLG